MATQSKDKFAVAIQALRKVRGEIPYAPFVQCMNEAILVLAAAGKVLSITGGSKLWISADYRPGWEEVMLPDGGK